MSTKAIKVPASTVYLGWCRGIWADVEGAKASRLFKSPTATAARGSLAVLLCSADGKRLFVIAVGARKLKPGKMPGAESLTARYKTWSGFSADRAYSIDCKEGTAEHVGSCDRIDYESDKWGGRLQLYTHDCKAIDLYRSARGATWAMVRRDGKKLISSRGIVG